MTDTTKEQFEFLIKESKADRFKRIVNSRVKRAVKSIQVIGNCSTSTYEYTNEQIDKLEQILNKEVADMIILFRQELKVEEDIEEI